ncbi:protein containing Glycosyl transferase, group 1 domain protein [gut metagenome]|uniref:Protein containing Glycosyl transferase, group 1 domain protein n=1 Tax=gut metagenome TaxID=749906 RepID=J9GN28_9ZZZZ
MSTGFNIHLIHKIQPDVIFIHSLSPATIPYIKASLHTHTPFVLALHGLFSQLDKNDFTTQSERLILPFLLSAGMPLTLVSSGMRHMLLDWYGWKECKAIHVVPNALNTVTAHHTEKHIVSAIPWKKPHRILSIGNLSIRKNQQQILRAFALLPAEIRSQSQLCLIGKDALNGQLQLEAEKLGIKESCTFTGVLPHEEVFRWIKEADIIVLASTSEGFGLSIIEGYHYGVPAVCFDRIEAFEDLYHKKCMMPAYEYTDEALACAIQNALSTSWDREFIRLFAEKFNNHTMASAYLNVLMQAQPTHLSEKKFDQLVDTYLK